MIKRNKHIMMILLFVFENYLIAAAATMREQFFETHLFPTLISKIKKNFKEN